jgi:uncharacterized protein YcfJ
MNTTLKGFAIGALTVGSLSLGAYSLNFDADSAKIISVDEVTKTVNVPRQECWDQVVTHRQPAKDRHQMLGTIAGAAMGGLVGNQIGGGSGKDIATAAGVIAGGYAGNKTQERMQQGNTYQTVEKRCKTVYDSKKEIAGYDVQYEFDDEIKTVRLDERPKGDSFPVEDGVVITGAAAKAQN